MANVKFDGKENYYNEQSPASIEAYARKAIGLTFREVLEKAELTDAERVKFNKDLNKGQRGQLIEKGFFGYELNSDSDPDFKEAGVELKVSGWIKDANGQAKAKERIKLTNINFNKPHPDDLFDSHVWHKCNTLLIMYYYYDRAKKSADEKKDYRIDYVGLFSPMDYEASDLAIIKDDYRKIITKIKNGQGELLSERETTYLGACTSGSDSNDTIPQTLYGDGEPTMRRAFSWKVGYNTLILNRIIGKQKSEFERIITDADALDKYSFEEYIERRVGAYIGKSDRELCDLFGVPYTKNKAMWYTLSLRMLGVKSSNAEEFVNANIVIKTVNLQKSGAMKDPQPTRDFKFGDIILENWEDSDLKEYLTETKFFYIFFQRTANNESILLGSTLWFMPDEDIDKVKPLWEGARQAIEDGITIENRYREDGSIYQRLNSFPAHTSNDIMLIKNHASKTFYRYADGHIEGDGRESDADTLPDGRMMPRQSFYMHTKYVMSNIFSRIRK